MNPTDPLANLADIHLPSPVEAWPPAIGWWLLVLLVIVIVIGVIAWLIHRYKKQAYRREALSQLLALQEQSKASDNPIGSAMALSALLKQVAITLFGRHEVAGLNGNAWLTFLDEKGKTQEFSQGSGKILGDDIYKPQVEVDLDQLFLLGKQWIEKQS